MSGTTAIKEALVSKGFLGNINDSIYAWAYDRVGYRGQIMDMLVDIGKGYGYTSGTEAFKNLVEMILDGLVDSLYWNPGMEGGTSFAAGVGIPPTDHVVSNNEGGVNATYVSGGNPAYNFNTAGLPGRLVFRQLRGTSADLVIGKTYRFQADVFIDQWAPVDPDNPTLDELNMLRGAQVNNNPNLTIDRSNADHSGNNGAWETTWTDFTINTATDVIYLHHGQGVITESHTNTSWRNISLSEIEPSNVLTHEGEPLTHEDEVLTHTE